MQVKEKNSAQQLKKYKKSVIFDYVTGKDEVEIAY